MPEGPEACWAWRASAPASKEKARKGVRAVFEFVSLSISAVGGEETWS